MCIGGALPVESYLRIDSIIAAAKTTGFYLKYATLPSIARINGACMAGGIGLLCMVDLAVAADHVLFGLPEVKGGVFPMQVSSLLQHLAPRRWVREWCITGEPFSAAAAMRGKGSPRSTKNANRVGPENN